ncbi:ABC-type metal ion transport system, periplasmic component/surface adhesin [Sphaerochaeta pleomorpha str. Grapes]|uniref:ABC-type metal ion transport system, periplasmic component/surface adhesin n=1 Tax=Sphaerochaeta pleomorpha (strain ATCC BAA-1885 / DSM 22778 / Grapes) TaxID=158190 RepID=G8QS05_SPHPG|nr:zinc ABC transporter substrate-binding protein [Sphaerochaeta pleomorpha]AEV30003.1 ABC-type metal ion transport system, periplasmic component/surface adhesin [Sphaerochaeta pleomorpha str. Grapes]
MKTKTRVAVTCTLVLLLTPLLFASGKNESKSTLNKPIIAVSILPQSYFVQRIAGPLVDVVTLVGPGQSPHSYEPAPLQMAQLAQASCWILSKTDFEVSLQPKIASLYPNLKMVDGTLGVVFRFLENHEEEGDVHVSATGLEIDRHSWLGHQNALILCRQILDTLLVLLPDEQATLEKNYEAFVDEINTTFAELKISLAPLRGSTVFVYHPSFGYFFDEFGITQEAVETGGKEPTAKALSELIAKAKAEQVTSIFVQAQFPVRAADTVAKAVGAQVLALDPLSEDWLANIRSMGDALLTASQLKR